jgi:uncharacterized protein (DUF983 family)
MTRGSIGLALGRGLRLRCPVCGIGRIFARGWRMREECPQCGVHFAREAVWLGSMDINLSLSLLLILSLLLLLPPLALKDQLMILGAAAVVLPAILFRFVRGAWVALLYLSGGVY